MGGRKVREVGKGRWGGKRGNGGREVWGVWEVWGSGKYGRYEK